jgi:hypothetical protein
MPAIGVRFDVGKLNSDCYGIASWKIFWRALPVQDLKRSLLFEGDTAASCAGRENVYCLALQNSDTAILDKVRAALSASEAFKKVCSTPMFVEGGACTSEPLPEAGKVDDTGTLVGGASNSKPALDVVAAERDRERERQTKAPERTVASERTHNLPAMADFRELRDFIAKTFTPNDAGFASEYWITPEELCDVVEHFTSLVKVQYVDKLARQQSKNLCCVRLFPQNASAPTSVTGEELARKEYIEFVGLFPFLSEQDAASFIKTSAPTPQGAETLRALAGIQGKYQMNFGKGSEPPAFNSYSIFPPALLWKFLWMRRQGFAEEIRREEEAAQERVREQIRRQEEARLKAERDAKNQIEEARLTAERDALRKVEEARRQTVMQERTARKACPLCGKTLGIWGRLRGRSSHSGCSAFRE